MNCWGQVSGCFAGSRAAPFSLMFQRTAGQFPRYDRRSASQCRTVRPSWHLTMPDEFGMAEDGVRQASKALVLHSLTTMHCLLPRINNLSLDKKLALIAAHLARTRLLRLRNRALKSGLVHCIRRRPKFLQSKNNPMTILPTPPFGPSPAIFFRPCSRAKKWVPLLAGAQY